MDVQLVRLSILMGDAIFKIFLESRLDQFEVLAIFPQNAQCRRMASTQLVLGLVSSHWLP